MKKITIDPVTRIEGHAKIDIYLDDAGPRRRHAVSRHPGARIREIHRRPAVLRDAVHHRAHLRHLPGEPSAGLGQSLRRHHGGGAARSRGHAARAGPLRAVRAVARAQLLPSFGARPAAGLRFRPGAPQRLRPDRRAPRAGAHGRGAAQVRPGDHRGPGQGAHASFLDRPRRRERAARPGSARPHSGGLARGARHGREAPSPSSRACWTSSPKRSRTSAPAPTMYAGLVDEDGGLQWYDGRLKFKDAEGATVAADIQRARLRQLSSAKRRCAIPT